MAAPKFKTLVRSASVTAYLFRSSGAARLLSSGTSDVDMQFSRGDFARQYTLLTRLSIEKAKESKESGKKGYWASKGKGKESGNQEYWVSKAFQYFKQTDGSVSSYDPILRYFIDCGDVDAFMFSLQFFKDHNNVNANCCSLPRLAYYEMLLWIHLGNEDKIAQLLRELLVYNGDDKSARQESYLLALGERDRVCDYLQLLATFDVAKSSSMDFVATIFKCLGKFLVEGIAKKILRELRKNIAEENLSRFICEFAANVMPSRAAPRVQAGLHPEYYVWLMAEDVALNMAHELDLLLSLKTLDSILHAKASERDKIYECKIKALSWKPPTVRSKKKG